MGINFNSGFNAGRSLPQAGKGKIRTTRLTIDGTTVRGTFPEQVKADNNVKENQLDAEKKATIKNQSLKDISLLNGLHVNFKKM